MLRKMWCIAAVCQAVPYKFSSNCDFEVGRPWHKKTPPTVAHEGFMVYTDPLHFFLFGDPGGECHPGWGRCTPK